jgi:hypothetical protein
MVEEEVVQLTQPVVLEVQQVLTVWQVVMVELLLQEEVVWEVMVQRVG